MRMVFSHIRGRKHACFVKRESEARENEALPPHRAADEAPGSSVDPLSAPASQPHALGNSPGTRTRGISAPLASGPLACPSRRQPQPGVKVQSRACDSWLIGREPSPMSCGDSPATRGLTPILGRQHQLREFFSRYWFCGLERRASPLPLLQPQFPSALNSRVRAKE